MMLLASALVFAQPVTFTDLGVIGDSGTYVFNTDNSVFTAGGTGNVDTELGLWDDSGVLLASDDDGSALASWSEITITLAPGVYFLGNSEFNSVFADVFLNTGTAFEAGEVANLTLNIDGSLAGTISGVSEAFDQETGFFRIELSAPACPDVSNLMAGNFADGSVDISWDAAMGADNYIWEIQDQGVAQGTMGAIASGSGPETSVTAMGVFVASQAYTLYVQSDCMGALGNFVSIDFTFNIPPANDTCSGVIDLGTLTSPISATTTGATHDYGQDCLNTTAPDIVYSVVVPDAYMLTIGQPSNSYDSAVRVAYGASCPGDMLISCFDDPDLTTVEWTNDTGSDQTVYWVQSGFGTSNGDFNLEWMVVAPPACPIPANLMTSDVTASGVTLTWDEVTEATSGYEWVIMNAGEDPTDMANTPVASGTTGTGVLTDMASGLVENTTYDAFVRANCDIIGFSDFSEVAEFVTLCPVFIPDYLETFDAGIVAPDCWEEATMGTPATGPSSFGIGNWTDDDYLNDTAASGNQDNSARVNLFANNTQDWLISPDIDLSGGSFELTYNVGVTGFGNQNASAMGSDDEVQLLITTDSGATWTSLITYNSSNTPPNTGTQEMVDLSAFSGVVTFAFWANDGDVDDPEDYDFFIDEFQVRTPPACGDVMNLMAGNFADGSVDISWDAAMGADNYNWEIQDQGVAQGTMGAVASGSGPETSVTAMGAFVASQAYTLYVQSDCMGNVGNFVSIDFITPPANDEPGGAIVLEVGINPLEFPVIGSNLGATDSEVLDNTIGAPTCSSYQGGDVWFSLIIPPSGNVTIQGNNAAGGFNDGGMNVYTSTDLTTEIGCDDDSGPGLHPEISLTGRTPGEVILIRYFEFGNNSFGDFQIVAFDFPCLAMGGTTVTWNGTAWDNITGPTIDDVAVINGDYDTGANGDITACNCQINGANTLTVASGGFLNVLTDIFVNGSLIVQNEGSVVQQLEGAVTVDNGIINVIKTTPSLEPRDFILLSSPLSGETRTGVYGAADRVFGIIPENFTPNTDPDLDGVIANFIDDNGDYLDNAITTLNVGEGYLVFPQAVTDTDPITFEHTYTNGTLNSGTIAVPTTYNGTTLDNFNLLGNPYPSAINTDMLIDNNEAINEVYFWEHITTPNEDLPGFDDVSFSMDDVSVRNQTMGVAAVNDPDPLNTPGEFMTSGQGFGILANQDAVGIDVTFTNSIRVTGDNGTPRSNESDNLLWLRLNSETYTIQSRVGIGFVEEATAGYDPGYDSKQLGTTISLFSTLESGEHLTIQGRESFDPEMEIQLGFSTRISEIENYTISIDRWEGLDLDNTDIFLIDKQLNTITNLKEVSYNFASSEIIQANRFTLVFEERALSVEDSTQFEDSITLFPNPSGGTVTLSYIGNGLLNKATVVDINGRIIRELNLSDFNQSRRFDISALSAGVYLIRIEADNASTVKRLIKR